MPDINFFASRLNRQLDRFVSWFPDTSAYSYNAFSLSDLVTQVFTSKSMTQVMKEEESYMQCKNVW